MKTIDPIIDSDLDAYVDGELTVARRVEVEILSLRASGDRRQGHG